MVLLLFLARVSKKHVRPSNHKQLSNLQMLMFIKIFYYLILLKINLMNISFGFNLIGIIVERNVTDPFN